MSRGRVRRVHGAIFALLLQVSVFSSLLHPCCLTHDGPGRAGDHEVTSPVTTMAGMIPEAAESAHEGHPGSHEGDDACCGGMCQCPCLDAPPVSGGPRVAFDDLPPQSDDGLDGCRSIPRPTPNTLQPFATGPPTSS